MNAIESLRIPALLDSMPESLRILFADDHEIFRAGLRQVLAASRERSAAEISRAVIDDCRSFAGELADDCAIVVIKRR